jgi:NAD(P)-dependent dehydrogenase (short-subunit alcohol dehydrogenase family)
MGKLFRFGPSCRHITLIGQAKPRNKCQKQPLLHGIGRTEKDKDVTAEPGKYATYPSLAGRSVFITGGGSGIGAELVRHFTGQGSRVAFVDSAEQVSHDLVDAIAAEGKPAPLFIPCDLREIDALQAAIAEAGRRNGTIEVLCNNAGNDDRHQTEDVSVAYWDDRMAVNLRHQFFAAQAVLPGMKAAGGGSIVNLGSITWLVGDPDCPAYVTAKAAVHGMTRALAREFGPHNIRVNCLVPGWVMTERQMRLWLTPAGERQIEERQCLRQRVGPADIARMALFLAADDSAMCTSQEFIVDGGWV